MSTQHQVRWWRLIDWRVVAAAGVPVWAAVLGLVAWDKFHAKASPAPLAEVAVSEPAPVAPTPLTIPPRPGPVQPPPVVVVPVVIPQPAPERSNEPLRVRDEPEEPVAAAGEEPVQPVEPDDGCKGYGTAVRFAKSPTEAMERAKKENKLVFVLHLSGNLEDDGFT